MPDNSETSKPTLLMGQAQALFDLGLVQTGEEDLFSRSKEPGAFPESEQKIGRYHLLRELGEGGFGIVWLAEQTEPLKREVAIKLIKPGMDSRQVIARFQAERQTLAMMDHPNVAAVLDAGATLLGRPFFVMQLVRGLKITEYCDRRQLSIRQRLELFLHVCNGVQHAHQKAILHRDLKPSNILVEDVDGEPVPKIIDFGIAKALAASGPEQLEAHSTFTNPGAVVGTPQYMSPEQAGSELDVDACSDIYSLGAILYELLTGQPPIPTHAFSRTPLPEVLRIIRETEPTRPSLLISHSVADEATRAAAEKRQTDPRRLIHELRSDLDWIVLKTLDKERRRRYESAAALAADIQRHLRDEPVIARPPTHLYVLRKLVRRNRVAFLGGAVMTLALVAGASAAIWGYVLQREALQHSLASEALARIESEKSRQVASFLGKTFQEVSLRNGSTLTADALRDLLDSADQRRLRELQKHPETDLSVSLILAQAYGELDKLDVAGALYQHALERLEQLGLGDSSEAADCLYWLAWTRLQRMEESGHSNPVFKEEQALRHCLAIRQRSLPPHNETVLRTQALLIGALRLQEKVRPARELLGNLANGPDSHAIKASPGYGWVLREEALLAQQLGDFAQSAAILDHALKYLGSSTMTLNQKNQMEADICRIRSVLCVQTGDPEGAENAANEELEKRYLWLGYQDPGVLNNIAEINLQSQRFLEAEGKLKISLKISRRFGWLPAQEEALRKLVQYQRQLYPEDEIERLKNLTELARVILLQAEQSLASGKDNGARLAEAAALLEADDVVPKPYPREAADFFATRASLAARREDYPAAIADLAKATSADPDNYLYRFQIAVFHLTSGNQAGYVTERENLLRALGAELNSESAIFICRATLLAPADSQPSLQQIRNALNQSSLKSDDRNALNQSSLKADDYWIALLMGMAEYRSGNYPDAVHWLDTARQSESPEIYVPAQLVIAMNRHRLHDPEAQSSLLEGQTYFADSFGPLRGSDSTPALHECLAVRLLKEEAEKTLRQTPDAAP